MPEQVEVRLTVNGKAYEGRCEPRKLLVDFIREDLGLTGTHIGCEHGVCGACTILFNGEAARSCLMFGVQAEGAELLTVEGLAKGEELHPLQQAFHEHHALQCGYCTPGMLIAALDFLATNPTPTEDEIREGISSVLCRCTGYVNIVKAVAAAAPVLRATAAQPASSRPLPNPAPYAGEGRVGASGEREGPA
jgi:aerobic-type carbon monoxide dehydrogenase small subunit (CoxS/CutS family)